MARLMEKIVQIGDHTNTNIPGHNSTPYFTCSRGDIEGKPQPSVIRRFI